MEYDLSGLHLAFRSRENIGSLIYESLLIKQEYGSKRPYSDSIFITDKSTDCVSLVKSPFCLTKPSLLIYLLVYLFTLLSQETMNETNLKFIFSFKNENLKSELTNKIRTEYTLEDYIHHGCIIWFNRQPLLKVYES